MILLINRTRAKIIVILFILLGATTTSKGFIANSLTIDYDESWVYNTEGDIANTLTV